MAITWDEYFMGLAHLSAMRSKDPNTQVGACIVDKDNKVVSIGYNGMPRGCNDSEYPWERKGGFLDTKYAFVVHAELNAILNSPRNLKDTILYVSLFPCNECAKAIIQCGIKKVIYESDKYDGTEGNIASKKMLNDAGIELEQLSYEVKITLDTTKE
ncbi:MAG: dCMP deaminase family protein [Erysipelotrichaceae bacterium]|nr:dCMP deaminase family protein [Erysipelotrichaceae bacterium]